jgi:hypothetical protein
MSLNYRQRQQLRRIDARLRRSDPELRAKFTMFGRLYEDQDMPATEQAPQARAAPDHTGFRRAAARIPLPRPRPGSEGRRGHPGYLGWEPDVGHTDG